MPLIPPIAAGLPACACAVPGRLALVAVGGLCISCCCAGVGIRPGTPPCAPPTEPVGPGPGPGVDGTPGWDIALCGRFMPIACGGWPY
jgi:hypothetical protein